MPPPKLVPGETLTLVVPYHRMIPRGSYQAVVISQLVQLDDEPYRYCLLVADASESHQFYVTLSLPDSPILEGYGFLGRDEYPITLDYEPSLELRLRLSLALAAKGDRLNESTTL